MRDKIYKFLLFTIKIIVVIFAYIFIVMTLNIDVLTPPEKAISIICGLFYINVMGIVFVK